MKDVRTLLGMLGLSEYAEAFEANRVDADILPHLTERDLSDLGLPIGPRRKILVALREMHAGTSADPLPRLVDAPPRDPERRQITVMFCDLVGSTALSEALDAEDLRGLMHAYQKAAGTAIERYAGHVAQYLGDGLMCYFGWPQAHEDDAQRAIMSAFELLDAVKALQVAVPLHVRIGIASGSVVIGDTGDGDASVPKLAIGETPNLAARIQSLAGAGEILIAATTRRLIGKTFELVDLGAFQLKGFAEPVTAWRVTGLAAAEGRFEAARGGPLTPFVGRGSELKSLLERWGEAARGHGQAVLVVGEPGIGKSRLTQVLRERIADTPHALLRYQCSPFHTSSALHPVVEHLERSARFEHDDDRETRIDKLEALLRATRDDPSAVAPLFAALLSLDAGSRYPPLNLTPQAQKDATLRALVDQVLAIAGRRPTLMIFEDVHWIDPTTQEALDLLLPVIVGRRILVVITYRPEYQPPWSHLPHVTPLPLVRLPRDNVLLMSERVSGGKRLPPEVLDQIIAKTDGVPLFVEELTKAVLESGIVTEGADAYLLAGPLPGLSIPSTLQDSLMARLDRSAPMREVAQTGACIGRQFAHDLLAAVSTLDGPTLEDALNQLVHAELVFRTGMPPRATYSFKHALVQDVAYGSLLKAKRRALHRRIADTLVRDFADAAASTPEILAHHYAEAAVFDQASRYWRAAAERASARFANTEAIAQFRKGLAAVAGVPSGRERVDLELDLRMGLAASLRMSDRYDEALDELRLGEELAARHQRLLALSRIHTLRGNIYFPLGQVERCFAEHQAALEFARQAGSSEDEARALGGLGDAYYVGGRFHTAHEQFERCVTLCRVQRLQAIEIAYLPMRATTHMYCSRFAEALDDCRTVNELVTNLGHARGEILSRNIGSWIYLDRHEFVEAEADARRGLEVVEKLGARRFVPAFNDVLARILVYTGDRGRAIELLEASWAISRETGVTFFGPFILGAIAWASPEPGRRHEALREGQALLGRGCVSHNYFWFYRDAIEVSLAEGDWEATRTYAVALERYFGAECAAWPAFIAARGSVLAELGSRRANEETIARAQRLRDDAARLGMRAELAALDTCLESARAAGP